MIEILVILYLLKLPVRQEETFAIPALGIDHIIINIIIIVPYSIRTRTEHIP